MDRLLPDLKASPRATPRPVTRPWSLAHTTLRKHYAYEEGFNAWDGDILDAPPGSISTATESVQRCSTPAFLDSMTL